MRRLLLGLMLVATVAACTRATPLTDEPRESRSHVQPIESANRASVRIESGGGTLTVGALDDPGETLSSMSYLGPAATAPRASYQVRDGSGELEYIVGDTQHRQTQAAELRVELARGVPLALTVESGGAQTDLDLTRLHLRHLDLQAGASDIRVRLPEAAGVTAVKVESGAAKLAFDVPPGVAADIQVSGALVGRSIDEARFRPLDGGTYRSTDYETAANRVDLHFELGAANLTVR